MIFVFEFYSDVNVSEAHLNTFLFTGLLTVLDSLSKWEKFINIRRQITTGRLT